LGLPKINIEFNSLAVSAIERSMRGVVALILKDDTNDFKTKGYTGIEQIEEEDWTPENLDIIQKTFLGSPQLVFIERLSEGLEEGETSYNDALKRLKNKKFNYLAVPQIDENGDTSIISTWIQRQRDNNKKTFKAVLPHADADHEGIINFTTTGITVDDKEYTTAEYTGRVAGALAALPFTRSATYLQFNEIDSIDEHENPNEAIDNGELILINDGENIKIGREVNSLTEITGNKTEDYQSIRVVEIMDLIKDDIRNVFENEYVGKVNNIYDNQVLFFRSVNAYFAGLAGDEILDANFDNRASVDVNAQRLAWEEIGTDTSNWDEQQVKNMSFKTNVFTAANVKIVQTIEDLDMQIAM